MEGAFDNLVSSMLKIYRNLLLRQFFFLYLRQHYEKVLYKDFPTKIALDHSYMGKPKDPIVIDSKVEAALQLANKVWTADEEGKHPRTRGRGTALRPKGPSPNVRAKPVHQSVGMYDFSEKFKVAINEELMQKYQGLKSRNIGVDYGGSGNFTKQKKAELAAKKGFIDKLKGKFGCKPAVNDIDFAVCEAYGVYKTAQEIKLILQDTDILSSFHRFCSVQEGSLEAISSLYKAYLFLNWIDSQVASFSVKDPLSLPLWVKSTIEDSVLSSDPIHSHESFQSEQEALTMYQDSCTREEMSSVTADFKLLEQWRINSEVAKFISNSQSAITSLPGLKVLYSLICSSARRIFMFTS